MDTIGKYTIIGEPLGAGGFGRVYKAKDSKTGRLVAIKILNVQNDEAMDRRFHAEAVTSASLQHKNIVTIFEFEEEHGVQYLVMEYLDGQNLQQLIDLKTPIPVLDKLTIMAEVAEGLQYAHKHGVIHRDVKPANIMRLSDGSVKIMDFGIARLTQKNTRLTEVGCLVGTLQYMAPEQFTGDASDARCDIWAYGVVLYEFLTGVNPFLAESPASIIYRTTHEDPPPISDSVPGLPLSLDIVTRRLLAKTKGERYLSLEDLRLDLIPVIQELEKSQVLSMEIQAEALIKIGQHDEAQEVVARILRFDQGNARAREFRTRLRDLNRRQAEEAQILALLEQADDKMTLLDFSAAELLINEALRIDPDNKSANDRMDRIRAERDKKARAAIMLAQARSDFERKALTSAFERVSEAVRIDAADADAAALLEQVRRAIAERDAEGRRKSGLTRARGLLLIQEYASAVALLQELTMQHPGDPEVLAMIEEAFCLQAENARERKMAAAMVESRSCLLRGAFQEAIDALSALDPESTLNQQVQQLLRYAQEQLDQQLREAEVERLLAEADACGADYDRALAAVGRALDLSPGLEKALRKKRAVMAAQQREEEAKIIEAEIRECRELIDSDRLEDAQTRARALTARHLGDVRVQRLVDEIKGSLRLRAETREREIEARRREAELLLDQGRTDAAIPLLQILAVRYKGEDVFADLLAKARHMEREKRERDAVDLILARVRELAALSRWGDARTALDQGLKQYPQSAALVADRERVLQQLLRLASRQREFEELLRRTETLIRVDQIEEAEKVLAELSRYEPDDSNVARLTLLLQGRRQRRGALAAADESRKRFEFRQARDMLQDVLQKDPGDVAAQALLEAVERESAEYARRQRLNAARTEADRLFSGKEYAAAVQVFAQLAIEYPDDVEIKEEFRHARALLDRSVRKEAYSRGLQELDSLMLDRRFDRAIAKAEELCNVFSEEPGALENLRRAREAQQQISRKATYDSGCEEYAALMRNRRFEQAVVKAGELVAAFPEDRTLVDDLDRAIEARDKAACRETDGRGRVEFDLLMKACQFEEAIKKAQSLVKNASDDPMLLQAAQELLAMATKALTDGKALKGPARHRNWLIYMIGAVVLALLLFGLYEKLKPEPSKPPDQPVRPLQPVRLSASAAELSFSYQIGEGLPQQQSFLVKMSRAVSWTVEPSDRWFRTVASTPSGDGSVAVSIVPGGLTAGEYSGIATIVADGPLAARVKVGVKLAIRKIPLPLRPLRLGATPPELSFSYQIGGRPPAPQSFLVRMNRAVSWTVKPTVQWFRTVASAQSGDGSVTVFIVTEALVAGEHTAIATVTAEEPSAAPVTVRIKLAVEKPPPSYTPPPPPPLPPVVDCHGTAYPGLKSGNIIWEGLLAPGQSVTIDRYNQVTSGAGGHVRGSHIPGCAITTLPGEASIIVTQPSEGDHFNTVTIKNIGTIPVNGPSFVWQIK